MKTMGNIANKEKRMTKMAMSLDSRRKLKRNSNNLKGKGMTKKINKQKKFETNLKRR